MKNNKPKITMDSMIEIIDKNNIKYQGESYVRTNIHDDLYSCNKCVFGQDPDQAHPVCLEIDKMIGECSCHDYWAKENKLQIPFDEYVKKAREEIKQYFRKKSKLPESWEEFCENNNVKIGECMIDFTSCIVEEDVEVVRNPETMKKVLPNRETAEAVLALCQLVQLREHFNQGWKPDWNNLDQEKYVIEFYQNKCDIDNVIACGSVLYFKTEELRDLFLEYFRPLIEKLKPLFGIMKGGEE